MTTKAKLSVKPWRRIRDERSKLTPARRAKIDRAVANYVAGMKLKDLRNARYITQQALAKKMGAAQPDVSRIEHNADLYISTLRKYVKAMGGDLIISVKFKGDNDNEYLIDQFNQLDNPAAKKRVASAKR
jgi:DNA-binding XRE family transcriptional regulator